MLNDKMYSDNHIENDMKKSILDVVSSISPAELKCVVCHAYAKRRKPFPGCS